MELNPEIRKLLQQEFIEAIKASGLVITERTIADCGVKYLKQQKILLSKDYLTAYQVSKYKLLPNHPTLLTIKNMVKDNRIGKNEHFYNKAGALCIMHFAIKRLRNTL